MSVLDDVNQNVSNAVKLYGLNDELYELGQKKAVERDKLENIKAFRKERGRPVFDVEADQKGGYLRFGISPVIRAGQILSPGSFVKVKAGPELYKFLYQGGLQDLAKQYFDYEGGDEFDGIKFNTQPSVHGGLRNKDWSHLFGPENPDLLYKPVVRFPEDFPVRSVAGKTKVGEHYKWLAIRNGLYPAEKGQPTVMWNGREIRNPHGFNTYTERMTSPLHNFNSGIWKYMTPDEIAANAKAYEVPLRNPNNDLLEIPEGYDPGVASQYNNYRGELVVNDNGDPVSFDYLADAKRRVRKEQLRKGKYSRLNDVLGHIAERYASSPDEVADFMNRLITLDKRSEVNSQLPDAKEIIEYNKHSKNIPMRRTRYDTDNESPTGNTYGRDFAAVYNQLADILANRGTDSEKELADSIKNMLVDNDYDYEIQNQIKNWPVRLNDDGTFTVNLDGNERFYNRRMDDEGRPIGDILERPAKYWGSQNKKAQETKTKRLVVRKKNAPDKIIEQTSVEEGPKSEADVNYYAHRQELADKANEREAAAKAADIKQLDEKLAEKHAKADELDEKHKDLLMSLSPEERNKIGDINVRLNAQRIAKNTGGQHTDVLNFGNRVIKSGKEQSGQLRDFLRRMTNFDRYPENRQVFENVGLTEADAPGIKAWLTKDMWRDLASKFSGADLAREVAARYANEKSKGEADSFSAGKFASALGDMLGK